LSITQKKEMKKTLLQEVKAMNKIAGTQMTKEQEIAIIRERLEQLNELEFGTQKAFDSYQKNHNLRDTTKVTVAGKKMSVSQAKDQSKDPDVKGTSVFGKDKGGDVFGKKTTAAKTDWDDDDSVIKFNSKVQSTLNTAIGSDDGYTNVSSGGDIEYNLKTKSGADPIYTLFIGPDERKKGKIRVSLGPSDDTNDPAKLSGKVDKSFNNEEDAIKYAGSTAKKYKRELKYAEDDIEAFGGRVSSKGFEEKKADALNTIGNALKSVQGSEEKMNNSRDMHQMVDTLTSYVKKGKIDKKEMMDAWDEFNKKNMDGYGDHKPLANLIFRAIAEQ
jgi:hypothetical protein